MEKWHERFGALLTEANMSAAEASRRLGVSDVTVLSWSGNPSARPAKDLRASLMLRICDEFDVTPEWLMNGRLPKFRRELWPFTQPREQIERLPPAARVLIDRIVSDIVEVVQKTTDLLKFQ
ncbi:MAG: hypothetical protein ACTHJ9_17225 [Rhodanobacter sp.]